MARKHRIIEQSNLAGQYTFAWKVFAAWDYAVTDPNSVGVKLKQHAISLREALFEVEKEDKVSFKKRWVHGNYTGS